MYDHAMDMAGQSVVVTGAASGIGAAVTASLITANATVHAIDIAPITATVAKTYTCDLQDRASIDLTMLSLPDRVDMLINCAGVPNGGRFTAAQVMAINWLGLHHLSEGVLDRIPGGGSITHVASTAGRGWPDNVDLLTELMAMHSFEDGLEWVDAHSDVVGDGYSFSKQAVQFYTLWRSVQLRPERDIRMNSVCPGVTNTQIASDFRKGVGDDVIDRAIEIAGRAAEPSEMAPALLFLADNRTASYINGINLNVDGGTGATHALGDW